MTTQIEDKDQCSNAHNHTVEPMHKSDYLGWHRWATQMSETHKQIQCPACNLWAIWIPKTAIAEISE